MQDFSNIKLIFLDVDGVIAKNYFTPVDPLVLNALKKLGRKYHVSLCTGRSIKSAEEIITGAELEKFYHVVETGSKVSRPGGDYAYEKFLTISDLDKVIDASKELTDNFGFCYNGKWRDKLEEVKDKKISIMSINTFSKDQTSAVLETIYPFVLNFHVTPLVSSFDPNGAHIHITHKEASKGFGTSFVQKQLGISKAETLGVGDSIGDFPMLKECGIKVVMGNADDEVKSLADIIIGDFEDGGLVEFINDKLL